MCRKFAFRGGSGIIGKRHCRDAGNGGYHFLQVQEDRMIYLFAAMHCEAEPLIRAMSLKAVPQQGPFHQWTSAKQDVLLTLTGIGSYSAAACVGAVLGSGRVDSGDILVSFGTCGSIRKDCRTGEIYRIHSIEDLVSRRCYVPDLLVDCGMKEASLLTGGQILDHQRTSVWYTGACELPQLYDMESAGICQAASLWMGPHQLHFFRVVSDTGDGNITPEGVCSLMNPCTPQLVRVLRKLQAFSDCMEREPDEVTAGMDAGWNVWMDGLRATAAMRQQAKALAHYAMLVGYPWEEHMERWQREQRIPCRNKQEGVRLLDELREAMQKYGL